jgi:predicted ATPase
MVQGIRLVNFANHKNTRLTFRRLTALVGQNGAGKTNVMRAIQELSKVVRNEVADANVDEQHARFSSGLGRRGTDYIEVVAAGDGTRDGRNGSWGVALNAKTDRTTSALQPWKRVWLWHAEMTGGSDTWWVPDAVTDLPFEERNWFEAMRSALSEPDDAGLPPRQENRPVCFRTAAISGDATLALAGSQYFKASGEVLAKPSYPVELPPRLDSKGDNLASTLATMMTSRPEQFRRVVEALKSVVPTVRGIRADRAPVVRTSRKTVSVNRKEVAYDEEQIVHGDQLIFDMASGEGISAQDVSEGTLLTLSLLTLLHGEPAPRVLLLDDVERGLHPRAQRDLIEQLRKVLELRPELQIILSSHSPYVIDQLKPEEVWLLAPDTEGCAVSRRLADHPNAVRALEVLTTGEFWSAEGEDWVLNEAAK